MSLKVKLQEFSSISDCSQFIEGFRKDKNILVKRAVTLNDHDPAGNSFLVLIEYSELEI